MASPAPREEGRRRSEAFAAFLSTTAADPRPASSRPASPRPADPSRCGRSSRRRSSRPPWASVARAPGARRGEGGRGRRRPWLACPAGCMPSRREERYFYLSSLLTKQNASPFAGPVGRGIGDAQYHLGGIYAFAYCCWSRSYGCPFWQRPGICMQVIIISFFFEKI